MCYLHSWLRNPGQNNTKQVNPVLKNKYTITETCFNCKHITALWIWWFLLWNILFVSLFYRVQRIWKTIKVTFRFRLLFHYGVCNVMSYRIKQFFFLRNKLKIFELKLYLSYFLHGKSISLKSSHSNLFCRRIFHILTII